MKTIVDAIRTEAKRKLARVFAGSFIVLNAGLVVSCSSINSENMPYAGATHFAPGEPQRVEILRSEPERPHERVGEVYLGASADDPPAVNKVEERLRTEAAKMGADAVVIVYDGLLPTGAYASGTWWGRGGEVTTGRKLVGVAIKYR